MASKPQPPKLISELKKDLTDTVANRQLAINILMKKNNKPSVFKKDKHTLKYVKRRPAREWYKRQSNTSKEATTVDHPPPSEPSSSLQKAPLSWFKTDLSIRQVELTQGPVRKPVELKQIPIKSLITENSSMSEIKSGE